MNGVFLPSFVRVILLILLIVSNPGNAIEDWEKPDHLTTRERRIHRHTHATPNLSLPKLEKEA